MGDDERDPGGAVEQEPRAEDVVPVVVEQRVAEEVAIDEATAQGLRPRDEVYVSTALTAEDDAPHALVLRKVSAVEGRCIRVETNAGGVSEPFAAGRAYKKSGAVGVLVLTVGDFATESGVLEPLRKTVLQYLRLLLPDDLVFSVMVRGQEELAEAWRRYEGGRKHIVLIGHGSEDGLAFGAEADDLPGGELAELLKPQAANEKKVYLSLACRTGTSPFAKAFSQTPHCEALVAPLQSIHGAVAALFCHAFFGAHFLDGRSTRVAFNKAVSTPGTASGTFRFWRNGEFDRGAAGG